MKKIWGFFLPLAALALIAGTATVQPATDAIAAAPGELDGLEYVSLGDSYSAGFGLDPYSTETPFVRDPNGCYQATANYPHNVAGALGLELTDQTCSGAVTANIGYPDGANIPLPPASPPLPALTTGPVLQTVLPGVTTPELQGAALSPDTDVVTIGISGNDLGFGAIAISCIREGLGAGTFPLYLALELSITVDNCADYFGNNVTYPNADLDVRLAEHIAPRIAATFQAVKEAAPNAQVFVVGYPQLTPGDATPACFSAPLTPDAVPFSPTDLDFLHNLEASLDGALQEQAADFGFHFVPTWTESADHTLCSDTPFIAGLTAYLNSDSPCQPNYIPVDNAVCVELGALHPNQSGVDLLTGITTEAVNSAFFVTPATSSATAGTAVGVTGGGFAPGEKVTLQLTGATTATLGSVTADSAGGFTTSVTLPARTSAANYSLLGTGDASDRSFSSPLAVTAALAATGSDVDALGVALSGASVLLLGGALFAVASIRRRSRTS